MSLDELQFFTEMAINHIFKLSSPTHIEIALIRQYHGSQARTRVKEDIRRKSISITTVDVYGNNIAIMSAQGSRAASSIFLF
jgi:hypothetical protein